MSHGFSFESRSTSNPKSSKHEGRPAWFTLETMLCSAAINVFTIMSWILAFNATTSTSVPPTSVEARYFHSAVRDHLDPCAVR
jgi:hypothetical protein